MLESGVDISMQQQFCRGETGSCAVMITEEGERTMCTNLGVNAFLNVGSIEVEWISSNSMVFLESYIVTAEQSFNAGKKLCKIAREVGAKIVISLSDAGLVKHFKEKIVEMVGGSVHWLLANSEEAMAFAMVDKVEQSVSALKQVADNLVITNGASAVTLYTQAEGMQLSPVEPIKPINTNGAGDCFAGAFISRVIAGDSAIKSAQFANKCAQEVIQQNGARLSHSQLHNLLLAI